jgi:hypothetical protein
MQVAIRSIYRLNESHPDIQSFGVILNNVD